MSVEWTWCTCFHTSGLDFIDLENLGANDICASALRKIALPYIIGLGLGPGLKGKVALSL